MTQDDLELEQARPSPAFRGALGRRLSAAWAPPTRPAALGAWVCALAAAGCALLLLALTQI